MDHLIRLPADLGNSPRDDHVLAIAVATTEGVAWQRLWRRLPPSHDHPGVESPGQRHPYALLAVEIPGQISREDFAEFPVIGFRLERRLLFPFSWLKAAGFALH